jgi:hypothetical protein
MSMKKYARVMVALTLAVAVVGCKSSKSATSAAVKVTDIDVGRSVAADKTIADKTDSFRPNDTFYVSVKTDGSAPSATLTARWTYEDGQVVDESRQDIIASGGTAVTEFHLSKPDGWPAGKYKVEVLLNGTPAGTKDFKVS